MHMYIVHVPAPHVYMYTCMCYCICRSAATWSGTSPIQFSVWSLPACMMGGLKQGGTIVGTPCYYYGAHVHVDSVHMIAGGGGGGTGCYGLKWGLPLTMTL